VARLVIPTRYYSCTDKVQEKRDHSFGRLYACKAIFQSDICVQNEDDLTTWSEIVELVVLLSKSIPWIREEAGVVLCDAIKRLSQSSFAPSFVSTCFQIVQKSQLIDSPEGVAIWLTVQSQVPTFKDYPKEIWAHHNPLHRDNASKLNRIMREQYREQDAPKGDTPKTGFWQQSVSFTWSVVIEAAIEADKTLETFEFTWKNIIDGD
jgi:DNA polymerase phi